MKMLVLSRNDLKSILKLDQVIEEVKNVYRLKSQGETVVWPLVSYDFVEEHAVMDIRSGYVKERKIHGLKMLNNFPLNLDKKLPTFNGMLLVFDSETGIPIGVMDAAYITCLRTGAAGALGAKLLAREDSKTALILGTGKQAIYQIAALLTLMPKLKRILLVDPLSFEHAVQFTAQISKHLSNDFGLDGIGHIQFEAVESVQEAVQKSDIIITITPAKSPVIKKEWVRSGTHFSCIGADMEGKEELDPLIFKGAKIYADDTAQCMRVGEMELPIKQGIISEADVQGELGALIDGKIAGRENQSEITIFDATGLALLDLVVGKLAIDYAHKSSHGLEVRI